jgi:hypothetical protein
MDGALKKSLEMVAAKIVRIDSSLGGRPSVVDAAIDEESNSICN